MKREFKFKRMYRRKGYQGTIQRLFDGRKFVSGVDSEQEQILELLNTIARDIFAIHQHLHRTNTNWIIKNLESIYGKKLINRNIIEATIKLIDENPISKNNLKVIIE